VYNSVNNILEWLRLQLPDAGDHQALMGGKQLAGASIAGDPQRTSRKVIVCEGYRSRIAVGRAGDLAQNPIVPTDSGQHDRRA